MTAKTKPATEHTRYWDSLGKTDPAHTKGFSRAGGFKGTAMKPIWIIKRMTEEFGPVGQGWGMARPEFQVVPAGDELMVYCTVAVWHTDPANLFYGVGGDKVVAKRSSGTFNSDEAFKMAYTDAVNNALKYLGIGADIHMGQFEDSKYLAEVRDHFNEPPAYLDDVTHFINGIAIATTEDDLVALRDKYAESLDAANATHPAEVQRARQHYTRKRAEIKRAAEAEQAPALAK